MGRGDRDSRYGRGGTNEDQGEQYSIAVLSTPSATDGGFSVDLDAYASYQELPAPHTQVVFPNQDLIIQALFEEKKAVGSRLKVLDHQIALPHEWQSKQQGISVGIDMTLPLKAKIALNAKAAINANLQGENRYYRPQLGLGLRFRLMD